MSAVLVEEQLLVGVRDQQVLVAIVREADFFHLGTLASKVGRLGSGANSAAFHNHSVMANAYLVQGMSLGAVAEATGVPEALLQELQDAWTRYRSNAPEYAVVEGVELSDTAERLHRAAVARNEVRGVVGVEVTSTGDATLIARRPDGHEVRQQVALLPSSLTQVRRFDLNDFKAPAP